MLRLFHPNRVFLFIPSDWENVLFYPLAEKRPVILSSLSLQRLFFPVPISSTPGGRRGVSLCRLCARLVASSRREGYRGIFFSFEGKFTRRSPLGPLFFPFPWSHSLVWIFFPSLPFVVVFSFFFSSDVPRSFKVEGQDDAIRIIASAPLFLLLPRINRAVSFPLACAIRQHVPSSSSLCLGPLLRSRLSKYSFPTSSSRSFFSFPPSKISPNFSSFLPAPFARGAAGEPFPRSSQKMRRRPSPLLVVVAEDRVFSFPSLKSVLHRLTANRRVH